MASSDRERTITVVSLVITMIAIAAYVTFDGGMVGTRIRGLIGQEDRLNPEVTPTGDGPHAFLNTQRGSDEPVGFSPCREIRYVVNPQGAPDGYDRFVEDAVQILQEATGLEFRYEGETDDRDFDRRGLGDRPDPVLIAWADDNEVVDLEDEVAGIGGPVMVTLGALRGYVTGTVVLDTNFTDDLTREADGDILQVALLLHELGHLVGLDHVDDTNELMYPTGLSRATYGPGDRQGLAKLGSIPCS